MEKREIRFDGWLVDFASGEIARDGHVQRLQDQPLQILDELTRQPGEVVTRETLIARLWPTGVVEFDTGLNTAVRKLRNALGDDAETPRYIETLPRKGYRFIAHLDPPPIVITAGGAAPATVVPDEGPKSGRRASDRRAPLRRLAWGFGSIAVAIVLAVVAWRMPASSSTPPAPAVIEAALPTVVVLPLVDMSIEQNEQPLCDGLTEELSNWLAHIPTLRVVARTSAFAFKGKNTDVRDIARQLGASHVLEGSLRRSGPQLRITTQLIQASTGLHIWSKSFALPMGDIFSIEDTVARSVAEALHLELSNETADQWAQRQPAKMEAYELYLLGRARQTKRTAEDNVKAAEFFRRAIAADPQFALGYTSLAETRLNDLSLNRAALEDVVAEVEPMINRAKAIAPNMADVLAAEAYLFTEQYKHQEALVLFQKAIAANPNDASSLRLLGYLYDRRGQPNEALNAFSTAAGLDPMEFITHVFRCQELIDLGDPDEAARACARARELEPGNLWGPLATAWIERSKGNIEGALRWMDQASKLEPGNTWIADQKIELLLARHRYDDADAVRRSLKDDGSFFGLAREGGVVFARGGSAALKRWADSKQLTQHAATASEMMELARIQSLSGDLVSARKTLQQSDRVLQLSNTELFDGGQIRHESGIALVRARIELQGGGDRVAAMKLLDDFDALLDTYEKSGGQHFGLWSLRAESYALRGDKARTQAALDTAWKHGWRATWRLERDPVLLALKLHAPG